MKKVIRLSIGLALFAFVVGDEPKKVEPAEAQTPLKASIGVIRDGGSSLIEIPAHEGQLAVTIYIDGSGNPATQGEMFHQKDFARDRQGKQIPWREADKILKQLEKVLIAHFGAEELLKIALNPIEPGTHLTEEEYSERVSKDPEFSDRLEAGYLMNEIMGYRASHGPVGPK